MALDPSRVETNCHGQRTVTPWLSVAEVARDLAMTPTHALRLIRRGSIPGGEMMYRFEGRKGERWHVDRELFDRWRESMRNVGNVRNSRSAG
jgi:hypothetical protein